MLQSEIAPFVQQCPCVQVDGLLALRDNSAYLQRKPSWSFGNKALIKYTGHSSAAVPV